MKIDRVHPKQNHLGRGTPNNPSKEVEKCCQVCSSIIFLFKLWQFTVLHSQICPTNVYDQIIQDSFQVREINYSKLRVNQNTRENV
ncbi:hypothetical protein T11_6546 [Trichinella zimbabwensis]|uniref:Uncharacterized protein n=1 Tax=Trichinella zimbabwensis TaxID=268475 RepID=A0A0V1GRF2_9BILA|nr:hypothetical protein T11_13860 [Trichinella zimbabwensis]KRZ00934.1 hypothetical protein T11_6546 [Trichinella zimbabwensis]